MTLLPLLIVLDGTCHCDDYNTVEIKNEQSIKAPNYLSLRFLSLAFKCLQYTDINTAKPFYNVVIKQEQKTRKTQTKELAQLNESLHAQQDIWLAVWHSPLAQDRLLHSRSMKGLLPSTVLAL